MVLAITDFASWLMVLTLSYSIKGFCKQQYDWRERVEMGRWFVLGFDPRVARSRRLMAFARFGGEVAFLVLVFSTAEGGKSRSLS